MDSAVGSYKKNSISFQGISHANFHRKYVGTCKDNNVVNKLERHNADKDKLKFLTSTSKSLVLICINQYVEYTDRPRTDLLK